VDDRDVLLSRRTLLASGAVALAGAAQRSPSAVAAAPRAQRTVRLGPGGWCWFTDPRALYFAGRRRRTYVGWISRAGDLVVASFDHATRRVQRAVLHRDLGADDHNNPSLLMGADGRLTVFYSAHPKGRHLYHRRMLAPEDVTRWGPEQRLGTNTPGPKGHTYTNALHLSAERRTYVFWRGGDWSPAFSRRRGSGPWSKARTLLHLPGERPYVKLHGDGLRTIHIAYTEGNPGSFRNSIYYLRLRDDVLWRAGGTRVAGLGALPLAPSRGERVYDASVTGVRAWVWDVAAHRDGRPVIVYVLLPAGDDCVYVYASWTGARWEQHAIVNAGGRLDGNYAPGIALDHEDPNVVVLSRRVGGRYVVQRWRTADRGATWTQGTLVHPEGGGDAIRPVVVRGAGRELDVLWMQGRYVNFRDYRTDIVAHLTG
jgi:hypothetical protein